MAKQLYKIGKNDIINVIDRTIGVVVSDFVCNGVMIMHIMIGDNRLEQVASTMSDAKAKEIEHNEQQSLMQDMDEKAKKASSDGVVLEISKTGVDASYVHQDHSDKTQKVEEAKKSEEKKLNEPLDQAIQEKQERDIIAAAQKKQLENINI